MHWLPMILTLACGRGLPGPEPSSSGTPNGDDASSVSSTTSGRSGPRSAPAAPLSLAPVALSAVPLTPLAELPTPPFADPQGWSRGSLAIDGDMILSGGLDGRLRQLDARSGQVLLSLPGHGAAITQVRLLPGRRVISGDADGALWLWELSGEAPLGAELPVQHASPILTLAVDPSGRVALSGDARGNVALWDLASGQRLSVLGGEESTGDGVTVSSGEGVSAAFSPDGARVALSGGGGGFAVYDVRSGEVLGGARWERLSHRPVAALAMPSADRVRVVHALFEGETRMDGDGPVITTEWTLEGERLQEHTLAWVEGATLAFSADGARVAAADWSRALRVWDWGEGAPAARVVEGPEEVGRMAFSADGRQLVFGGGWSLMNVLDVEDMQLRHPGGPRLPDWMGPIDLSAQGVAALNADPRLWLWTPGGAPRSFALGVDAVSFVREGARIAALGDAVWVLDLDSGALLFEQLGQLGYVTGTDLDASADGEVLVLGEYEGHLSVIDGQTGALKERIETDDGELYSLWVRADGRAVASIGSRAHLRVRALPSGELTLDVALEDGSEIRGWGGGVIAVTGDGALTLYDAETGAAEPIAEGVRWSAAALSLDGRWLAWGHEAGDVVVLDRSSGSRHRLTSTEGPVQAIAIDPQGERVLMSWSGGLARIYALKAFQELDAIELTENAAPATPPEVRALRTPKETLPPHALGRLPALDVVLSGPGPDSVVGVVEGKLVEVKLPTGEVLAERALEDSYPELRGVSPESVLLQSEGLELLGPGLKGRPIKAEQSGLVALSPDGSQLAVADSGALRILSASGEALREQPQAYADYANVIAWSPEGRYVAVAGTDLIVRVWRAEDLSLAGAFRAMAEVRELAFISEQALAWTADANRDTPGLAIGRWGEGYPAAGQLQVLHRGWELGQRLAVHPDGGLVAAPDDSGVRFYDAETGAYVARLPTPFRPNMLAFSPDGAQLVTTTWGEGALVWDLSWLP